MVRYSNLANQQVSVFLDEFERQDVLGSPKYHALEFLVVILIHIVWIVTLPVTWCLSFKIVRKYERCMVYRLGRLMPLHQPGLMYVIPCIDKYTKVDMRTKAFNVPPQMVYTIDNGVVKIGADVQYRIADPLLCYGLVRDVNHTLRMTAQATLNNSLSGKRLAEIETDKQFIGTVLQMNVNKSVASWGIEISRFELSQSFVIKSPKSNQAADFPVDQDPAQQVISLLQSLISPGNQSTAKLPNNQPAVTAATAAGPDLLSTAELFDLLRSVIDTSLVHEVDASFLIRVIDHTDTEWCLDLKNPPGSCQRGVPAGIPDVVVTVSSDDLQKLFYGQLSPQDAYLNGMLQVDGDLKTALKLKHVVERIMNPTAVMAEIPRQHMEGVINI